MNAIKLLTKQHRSLESELKLAVDARDGEVRAASVRRIGDELGKHLESEEQVFYPAVKAKATEDILLESLEEHLSLKRLLADLLELDPASDTWEPKLKVLKEQTEHHHKEEEEHLFPKVSATWDAPELDDLGQRILQLQLRMQEQGGARTVIAQQTGEAAPLT